MSTLESKYISLPLMSSMKSRGNGGVVNGGLGNSMSVRNLRGLDLGLGDSMISRGGLRIN